MRREAVEQATLREGWKRLAKEIEPCYLGRDAQGKVAWLDRGDLGHNGRTALEVCNRTLTELCAELWPLCEDALDFVPVERSDGLLRLTCESASEEDSFLSERDVLDRTQIAVEGKVEDHIKFAKGKKVCVMLLLAGSGTLVLHSPDGFDTQVPMEAGQLVTFRHDRQSYTLRVARGTCVLQAWIMTAESIEIEEFEGPPAKLDEASGLVSGPPAPQYGNTGKSVSLMCMDCMLAGNGLGIPSYWGFLISGTDTCRELSLQRWNPEPYFEPNKEEAIGKYYSNHGGFVLEEQLLAFDPAHFGFTEDEAFLMDPCHRNTLEVGYNVLFQAGMKREKLNGAQIGVFLGNCGTDWNSVRLIPYAGAPFGNYLYDTNAHICAGRISYVFGMRGPFQTSDTACSSSLVAAGIAHNVLRRVEPDQNVIVNASQIERALVMGTNALLGPFSWIGLCGPHMLSPAGRCFTFNASADGFARGEGTSGLLMQVTDKEPSGRLAMFCGSCINQDGRSASMTAPHGPSQQECLRASLREASVVPGDIRIAELHGTGTALGDPIEIGALRGVMKVRQVPILKTSSKSNMAHGEANAGMAGLIKCALMLVSATTPPNVHLQALNPHADVNGYPVLFADEMVEMGTNSGYAGVSSFGFGGTNARADLWAKASNGTRKVGSVDFSKLDYVCVRCPRCKGWMDYVDSTMTPSRSVDSKPEGGRKKSTCIRDEFDTYEVCSLCYEGSYVMGSPPREDPLPRARLFIAGTWDAYMYYQEMQLDSRGEFRFAARLGETRQEHFRLVFEKNELYSLLPMTPRASSEIRIEGPAPFREKRYWLIDGVENGWPEGALVHIRLWTESKHGARKISWEVKEEEDAPTEFQTFKHNYFIVGSWTSENPVKMKTVEGVRGRYEYYAPLGLSGVETFQFRRDNDKEQVLYPAKHLATESSVQILGPDASDEGRCFCVRGQPGDKLTIRLEVVDGSVTVLASCPSGGTRRWRGGLPAKPQLTDGTG